MVRVASVAPAGLNDSLVRDRRELIWHDVERELITSEQAEEMLRDLARGENDETTPSSS